MPARPSPLRWLGYAAGARLPDRFDDWVFSDLTRRGWWLREVGRIMILPLPFVIGALFLPGSWGLRIATAMFLVVGPLFVAVAFADEMRAYRLRQHGLLPPSGPEPDRR